MPSKSWSAGLSILLKTPHAERPILIGPRYKDKTAAKWAHKVFLASPCPLLTETDLQKVDPEFTFDKHNDSCGAK